jgi:uncharacterized membrane protein YozB (DUF420 family)
MTATDVGDLLAPINAGLNTTSFLLLILGYLQIRRKNVELHRKCMVGAFGTSVVFLVSYLTRYALTGTHRFPLGGGLKALYLSILFSHMILAVVVLPLVLRTLYLASKGRFAEHRKIARITYPIWVYVSLTGVLVYVLLYQVPRWIG